MDLFVRIQPPVAGAGTTSGDINGDGYRDIVIRGPYYSYMMGIWLAGREGFVERTADLAPRIGNTLGVVVGRPVLIDMDRDGDLDFVSGHAGFDAVGRNWLALNDGKGRFTDASDRLGLGPTSTQWVTVADFNRDGYPDLFFSVLQAPNILLLSDGKSGFRDVSLTHLPASPDQEDTQAAAGDVDGDGDVDLVACKFLQETQLLLNDGTGRFVLGHGTKAWPYMNGPTTCAAIADLDGDGDADVVVGEGYDWTQWRYGRSSILFNDGTGNFRVEPLPQPKVDGVSHLQIGDLNGDGRPEIVAGSGNLDNFVVPISPTRFYLNLGSGKFQDVTQTAGVPWDQGQNRGLEMLDLDGDGDLDLVSHKVTYTLPTRWWINTMRQCYAPYLPRLGYTWNVELYARQGQTFATPILGLRDAQLPIPGIGLLRVDPTAAILLGGVDFLSGPKVTLGLPIPQDQALRGLPLYVQAYVLAIDPTPVRAFTNLVADTIR